MTAGPPPRERLRPGLVARAAAPAARTIGDLDLARAVWAFAHGVVILARDGRFPPDADLDAAWATGLSTFGTASTPKPGASASTTIANWQRHSRRLANCRFQPRVNDNLMSAGGGSAHG